MRVIAGIYKGRRIECPEGKRIRPTSDMIRGAVFNILANFIDWENTNVLDLCCGTGALGIEALSRGAKLVTFIDNHRESMEVTRFNLEKIKGDGELITASCEALPKARRQYEVIFLDPPYSAGLMEKALKSLRAGDWIAKDGVIISELALRDKFTVPEGFRIKDERDYGKTKIIILSPQPE